MKKGILLLVFGVLLSACGRQPAAPAQPHFSVCAGELEIALDAPAAPILAAMGSPFGYAEARSSRCRGVEKTYRFSQLRLKTYPGRDGERILGFSFADSGLETQEGISLGATADQVRQCYGSHAMGEDCCIVDRGREKLTLLLNNNIVTGIEYALMSLPR